MNKEFREKLTEIIEMEVGKNWWVPENFERHIRAQLPLELKIIAVPPAYDINYNCFVFAFGLENDSEFLGCKNPVQQEFIRHLLSENILKVKEVASSGDLVFYEDESGSITHGGIMQSENKVISKWMWGPLIEHDLMDVPASFGDKVFFCEPIESEIIKTEYRNYKNSGVYIKPIS